MSLVLALETAYIPLDSTPAVGTKEVRRRARAARHSAPHAAPRRSSSCTAAHARRTPGRRWPSSPRWRTRCAGLLLVLLSARIMRAVPAAWHPRSHRGAPSGRVLPTPRVPSHDAVRPSCCAAPRGFVAAAVPLLRGVGQRRGAHLQEADLGAARTRGARGGWRYRRACSQMLSWPRASSHLAADEPTAPPRRAARRCHRPAHRAVSPPSPRARRRRAVRTRWRWTRRTSRSCCRRTCRRRPCRPRTRRTASRHFRRVAAGAPGGGDVEARWPGAQLDRVPSTPSAGLSGPLR